MSWPSPSSREPLALRGIFYGCPGAWAGNKPEPNSHGSLVINGANIVAAIQYLTRHRLRVLYHRQLFA